MKYKYSIIIPHYNDLIGLNKLIKSIPLRDDIEIIIIDDNSDELLDLSSFCGHHISLLINDTGVQSAGACRNIGIKKASGKWLLFADSDDYFLSSAFNIFDRYFNSQNEIIFFSPTSIDLQTGLISNRHFYFQKLVRNFINDNNEKVRFLFSVPWSKLILNSFIQKHSFKFDEIIASNDIIFSLKVGSTAKYIKAIDENVYCVTKRQGSLTTSLNKDFLKVRFCASMRRNDLLFKLKVKYYQESMLSLIKKYYKVMEIGDLYMVFKLVLCRRLIFFPSKFQKYFNQKL